MDDGIADTLVAGDRVRATRTGTLRAKDCETPHDPHLVDFHWVVVVKSLQQWGVISQMCTAEHEFRCTHLAMKWGTARVASHTHRLRGG